MDKQLQENMPIYMQIMQKVREAIASGELAPGVRVASVRELAGAFAVNPNTMQRALNELEREGLLVSERTSGRFVTKDTRADRRDAAPACGGGRGAVSQGNADAGIQRGGDAGVFSCKCG